ncbi:MAG: hypothetical protein Q9174_001623 [Haloplaca sp. 1 TL-2023]
MSTGCITCKKKRLKCDETKPACENCRNKGRVCEGYKKDYGFRAWDAKTSTTKPISPEIPSSDDQLPWPRHGNPQAAPPGPTMPTLNRSFLPDGPPDNLSIMPSPNNHFLPREFHTLYHPLDGGRKRRRVSFQDQGTGRYDEALGFSTSSSGLVLADVWPGSSPPTLVASSPQSVWSGFTHHPARGMEYQSGEADMLSYLSLSQPLLPGNSDATSSLPLAEPQQDEEIEEVSRQPEATEDALVAMLSPNHFQSSLPFPAQHLRLSPISDEMLVMRFDRQTCGILSVVDGRFENPWRTIVWPLAQDAPSLHHALFAMTAFHASKDQKEIRNEGIDHFIKGTKYLREHLYTNSMSLEAKLATTLALAFSQSWDHHTLAGTLFLNIAKGLVHRIRKRDQGRLLTERQTETLKFLSSTWIYMDVIARLTSVDDDKSTDFAFALYNLIGPCQARHKVDPLMGCASTLFPLVGQVANVVRHVSSVQMKDDYTMSYARVLKKALEQWAAPSCFEVPEDQTSEVQHSLATAEAYRYATMLYLHQAVPELKSKSSHELAMATLESLRKVPMASRAVIVQIYPLLAAGCEATSIEDRLWVKNRWEEMMQRMLIGNLDKCLEVTKLVWDRRDNDESVKARQGMQAAWAAMSRRSSGDSPYEDITRRSQWSFNDGNIDYHQRFSRAWWRHSDDDGTAHPLETAAFITHEDLLTGTWEILDYERTVNGRLHWRGVMKDRGWEILLG